MNKTPAAILSHTATLIIFIPICLPLLFIMAVLFAVGFCAVVYERLYVGIKYLILEQHEICDFCRQDQKNHRK